jgi:hypothetical protein
LGFEKAGFETVFANDFEEKCKTTYDLNFPTSKLIVEDIRKLGIGDLPEFDFLLGVSLAKLFQSQDIGRDSAMKKEGAIFFLISLG